MEQETLFIFTSGRALAALISIVIYIGALRILKWWLFDKGSEGQ